MFCFWPFICSTVEENDAVAREIDALIKDFDMLIREAGVLIIKFSSQQII